MSLLHEPLSDLPSFIGIGAQKSGTTWLYEKLCLHPDIYFPVNKELHYFNKNYHTPLKFYKSYFVNSNKRICGEVTPAYMSLPKYKIRYIKKVMPDVRLILILRNPIERAWSQLRMHTKKLGYESTHELGTKGAIKLLETEHFNSRGDYYKAIQNWRSIFNEGQLLILNYSHIKVAPEKVYAEICAHINVKTPADLKPFKLQDVIFSGKPEKIPNELEKYLTGKYSDMIAIIKAEYPEKFEDW